MDEGEDEGEAHAVHKPERMYLIFAGSKLSRRHHQVSSQID